MRLSEKIAAYSPSANPVLLAASNTIGFIYTICAAALTIGAAFLSSEPIGLIWFLGQLLFALAFLQWFIILHEAGHRSLFRARWCNQLVGTLAGFFALIPYSAWSPIHARHHVWTGWQDKDPTTASLVPRPLTRIEKIAINFAWRTSIPFFSIVYRLQNYWHLKRLKHLLSRTAFARVQLRIGLLITAYIMLIVGLGPAQLAHYCGVGLLLSLAIQDPLLLSQHTHMPRHLAGRKTVKPFSSEQQEIYTRSIRFPRGFSLFIMHFDAHELHHIFREVPGYRLRRIDYQTSNEVNWWQWLKGAKRLSGVELLFSHRDETGFHY